MISSKWHCKSLIHVAFVQAIKLHKYFVVVVLASVLAACSVNFSQMDTVRLLFRVDERPFSAVEWIAEWEGDVLQLYAADSGFETVFLSGSDIRLYFSDFQFSEAVGILPNSQRILIEKDDETISFWLDNELIARDTCEDWQISDELQISKGHPNDRYIQPCVRLETFLGSKEGITYQNEIDVSAGSLIARLKFLIHPEYSPIVMSLTE